MTHPPQRPQIEATPQAWTAPIWEDGKVINKGQRALWSGKERPPEVGSYVATGKRVVRVLGYYVESGWLLIWGAAQDERDLEGNLAGMEITNYHPEGY